MEQQQQLQGQMPAYYQPNIIPQEIKLDTKEH